MNYFLKLVSYIITGIDRIQFSLPIVFLNIVLSGIDLLCDLTKKGKFKTYWYKLYYYNGCKILIAYKDIKHNKNGKPWDRFYITISDPYNFAQDFLYTIFSTAEGEKYSFYNITINQLEVAYDIYPTESYTCSDIKNFLIRHIFMKYSRLDSYNTHKDTFYIGQKGNVRNGIKGIRLYEKTEHGETFFRLEVQFNRRYLNKINLQYKDLPVSPLSFNALSFVELLDTFSDKGVQNLARNILRSLGVTPASANFNQKHKKIMQHVRKSVIGGTRGMQRRTSSQIGQAKLLKKKYKVSSDIMQYFHHLDIEKQLIACHSAVGCDEENADKRMMFCESAEEE